MPNLSMLSDNSQLKTCLVYQTMSPLSLLDDLRGIFERVIYYSVDGFHMGKGAPQPTAEEFEAADVLFAVQLPSSLISIDQTPRLRLFQALSSGTGHITSTPFWKSITSHHPLVFCNAAGLQVSPIGEHVVACALMLWHRLPTLIIRAHQEESWLSAAEMGGGHYIREMRGATVGVLGYGAIGREVARLCSTFGTTILACTRSGRPSAMSASTFQLPGTGDSQCHLPAAHFATNSLTSFHEFLSRCDIVVNTLPGTAGNENIIGEDELRVMKGDALLINVGRGTTVDTEALVRALTAKQRPGELVDQAGSLRIGAAALDVTNPEPLPKHHPLFSLFNCIVTPHCSGLSRSYLSRAVELLAENVQRTKDGRQAVNERLE